MLYAGTELGLWVSFDAGARWTSLRQNMPPVPVRDIQIQPRDNDLLVATHGRGLYVMDDIAPLQHIGEAIKTDAALFDIRPATRWTIWNKDANLGQAVWRAPNPPNGAILDYYLKNAANDVVITITDKSGKEIRTIRNAPKNAGLNRVVWDLHYDAPRQGPTFGGRGGRGNAEAPAPPAGLDEEPGAGRFGGGGAPFVVPGEYVVKLRAAGKEESKTVKVDIDPRAPVPMADLQAQLEAGLTLRDMTSRVNTLVGGANSLVQQLTALQTRLKQSPGRPTSTSQEDGQGGAAAQVGGSRELQTMVDATLTAAKKLLEDDLARPFPGMGYRQYPRLREEIQSLNGSVTRAVARPTDPELLRMKELQQELDDAVSRLTKIQTDQVAKINQMMKAAPFITTETIK